KQAEFFIGPDRFQTAVRAFLKRHAFSNASWGDLVTEFEAASGRPLVDWASQWVTQRGLPIVRSRRPPGGPVEIAATDALGSGTVWEQRIETLLRAEGGTEHISVADLKITDGKMFSSLASGSSPGPPLFLFPNRNDYGYGIFLLDDESRTFIVNNIQNEKDDFLRTMLWGSLWDSVREAELDPKEYVELVIKVLGADIGRSASAGGTAKPSALIGETDESTIQTLLGRVSTAMNYYVSEEQRAVLAPKVEELLTEKMQKAPTPGQRITYYRAFLGIASTSSARRILKEILHKVSPSASKNEGGQAPAPGPPLASRTKDRFDIVARLIVLGDPDAQKLLADLEAAETSDEAKRYAYAARAGEATSETKARYWNDFTTNKAISESWIEASFGPFNPVRQSGLTLPYLERALAELPALKRDRKIFFVNGWLGAFIGGHRSEEALAIVNKFLADNPSLDNDLRLKILENVDTIERAVKIRSVFER
ncbi:MAG TPA: M1 family metallopeptidase, partial [Pyrinomonadaceae bacterium]|nr:M1 family metallopeptidase [Pyrinomonadaceae bacterium]